MSKDFEVREPPENAVELLDELLDAIRKTAEACGKSDDMYAVLSAGSLGKQSLEKAAWDLIEKLDDELHLFICQWCEISSLDYRCEVYKKDENYYVSCCEKRSSEDNRTVEMEMHEELGEPIYLLILSLNSEDYIQKELSIAHWYRILEHARSKLEYFRKGLISERKQEQVKNERQTKIEQSTDDQIRQEEPTEEHQPGDETQFQSEGSGESGSKKSAPQKEPAADVSTDSKTQSKKSANVYYRKPKKPETIQAQRKLYNLYWEFKDKNHMPDEQAYTALTNEFGGRWSKDHMEELIHHRIPKWIDSPD